VDVYLVHSGEAAGKFAWNVAETLRGKGLSVVFHCGGGSFKSQMKRADATGARFAVIVGDDEAAEQVVALKPLREPGEQAQVSADEAARIIRSPNFSTT
jgi:histidyl-tRNA synthetase